MSYIRRRPNDPKLIDPAYAAFCRARQLVLHALGSRLNTDPSDPDIDFEVDATCSVVRQTIALFPDDAR